MAVGLRLEKKLAIASSHQKRCFFGNSQNEGRVVFERQFPASLGTPIIADLDGGGNIQIIVGCADGNLYSLKPS